MRRLVEWAAANRWWLALGVCALFGYQLGKDMALRDNRAAAAAEPGER